MLRTHIARRLLSSSWTPLLTTSSQTTASLATAAGAASRTEQQDECWSTHTKTHFTIRPSLLSPLYSAYRSEVDRQDRRHLIGRLLEAHMLLSRELEGFDMSQVTSIAREHTAALQQLSRDLERLGPRSGRGTCTDRSTMLGYYTMLEKQLGTPMGHPPASSSSSSGSGNDSALSTTHESVPGASHVWQAWMEQFVSKYRHSPSLEPLDVIYSKKDLLASLSQLGKPSKGAHMGLLQSMGDSRPQEGRQRHGAFIDLQGVACAEGKRKTSRAMVRMERCTPPDNAHVSINGVPYTQYFQTIELRQLLLAPMLLASHTLHQFRVHVDVRGGGISSQAQAARTGIARALRLFVRSSLPSHFDAVASPTPASWSIRWLRTLARWDKRSVERKKPGKEKARKSFAWVKR